MSQSILNELDFLAHTFLLVRYDPNCSQGDQTYNHMDCYGGHGFLDFLQHQYFQYVDRRKSWDSQMVCCSGKSFRHDRV